MSGAIGSTPGNYHRRSANMGYTPGSHYQRFGKSGLIQSKNMTSMNRSAVDNVRAAYLNSGPQVFDAKAEQSYGLSELAAEQVLKRAQEAMNKLAAQGESTSASVNMTV
jgi:ribosomal protein L15